MEQFKQYNYNKHNYHGKKYYYKHNAKKNKYYNSNHNTNNAKIEHTVNNDNGGNYNSYINSEVNSINENTNINNNFNESIKNNSVNEDAIVENSGVSTFDNNSTINNIDDNSIVFSHKDAIKNKKRIVYILGALILILGLFGITYAAFNYINIGTSNSVEVGRMAFNISQTNNQLTLTNIIPISSSDALTDENNVAVVNIGISGDTEYEAGIEYLLTAVGVNNVVNNKTLPISIMVSYDENTGKSIGTEDNNYFTNRGGDASLYKILASNNVSENDRILVGYIKPGETGIDGTLTIRAYIDSDDLIVSDTYSEQTNKTVLTTDEWDSFIGNNAFSFKVKVEASEGVWVSNSASAYTINFNSEGGSQVTSIEVDSGDIVGEFPQNPTRAGYVFNGWFTEREGGTRVTESTQVNANMSLHAQWDKLVCLKVTDTNDLHTETCTTSGSKPGSCATSGYTSTNPTIRYGTIATSSGPVAGDAYNCDVNNDDNYTSQSNDKFTERFYFVKASNNNASLIYFTSIDADGVVYTSLRQGGSYHYDVALTYLPSTSTWSNSKLTTYNGKAARLLRYDEVPTECVNAMSGCQYMMENSRFQDDTKGRAGIWLERDSENNDNTTNGYRIQSKNKIIASSMNTSDTSSGSENTTRPVIQIPARLIEGYKPTYHVTFDSQGGSNVLGRDVAEGEQLGTLPTNPTKLHYTFAGWYTSTSYTKQVTSSTVIESERTFYAKWVERDSYTVTFETDGGTQIEPVDVDKGSSLGADMPANPTKQGYNFIGWYNQGFTVEYDENTVINSNMTFYAKWEEKSGVTYLVSFEVDGGTPSISPITVDEGDSLGANMPANPTKTNYVFDGWYNQGYTVEYDENTVINSAMTFYARWMPSNTVAKMNNQYYTTIQAAINAAPTSTKTTILMVKDIDTTDTIDITSTTSNTNKNLVLDLGGHILNFPVSSNTSKNVIKTASIIEIKNGSIISSAKAGAIDIASGGKLIMNSGSITATGARQAVYNEGGIVEIGGTAEFTSNTSGAYNNVTRGTVQSNSGSMTITGGTITNSDGAAVSIGTGTLVIGTENNVFNTSSPVIQGKTYGVSSATVGFSFFDGILKGQTNSTDVDIDTQITSETNATKVTGTDGAYKTLIYQIQQVQSYYTLNLNAGGGTVSPSSVPIPVGDTINSSTLPTPTWTGKTFGGWYSDEELTTAVPSTITALVSGSRTLYAKWTYTPSGIKATYDSTGDAMATYFTNISTWKDLAESTFGTTMRTNFDNYSCSSCNAENNCTNPLSGNQCDKPKSYTTSASGAVKVYLYDETNHVIKSEALYANGSSGTISNLIPGQTYYWEKVSDPTVNGLIECTATKRTIDAGNVRNVRDLGGMSVDTDGNGTIDGTLKYGRLYRGAKLTSSQDDVTALSNLGITREIDLRADSEGSGQARMPVLDNGSGGADIVIENYLINRTAVTYSFSHGGNPYTSVVAHASNASALKDAMKQTMQYIIGGDNIYFHCTIGTDRTGTIAYFLEGLLGVSEEDRIEDYELSYFFGLVVNLGARHRYHEDLTTTSIYPRFKFMRTTYKTNQDIYNWFVDGDNASELASDNQLIADFRAAMINYS